MEKYQLFERRKLENLSDKDMQKANVERYVHAFKLSKLLGESELMYRYAEYIFNVIGVNLNTAAFLTTI
jgi:hypothetical protein